MPILTILRKNRNSHHDNTDELSAKSIKSSLKSFWHRHSSRKKEKNWQEKISSSFGSPTLTNRESKNKSSDCFHNLTSGNIFYENGNIGYEQNTVLGTSNQCNILVKKSFPLDHSLRMSASQVSSSLEQAMMIAGGFKENNFTKIVDDASRVERCTSNFDNQIVNVLPRIPENAVPYTKDEIERLKSSVTRREHSNPKRSEFFSAPPGVYWPDVYPSGVRENTYDSVQSRIMFPSSPTSYLMQNFKGDISHFPRLSRISSSAYRMRRNSINVSHPFPKLSSVRESPVRSTSPTFRVNRPLPPTPYIRYNPEFACCDNKVRSMQSNTDSSEFEIIDSVVYSNVHIPIRRVISPSNVEAFSTQPNYVRTSPFLVEGVQSNLPEDSNLPIDSQRLASRDRITQHPNQTRNPVSPVDRRRLSPIVRTSPSLTGPAVLGHKGINHHPSSPFAPIFRIPPGGNTSPPAVSSRIDSNSPHNCCPNGNDFNSSLGVCPTDVCQCSRRSMIANSKSPTFPTNNLPSLNHQSTVCVTDLQNDNSQTKLSVEKDDCQTVDQLCTQLVPQSNQRSISGRRDLVATYEEAWDVKMSRRLGGLDVSRLALTVIQPSDQSSELFSDVSKTVGSPPVITNGECHRSSSPSVNNLKRFEKSNEMFASDLIQKNIEEKQIRKIHSESQNTSPIQLNSCVYLEKSRSPLNDFITSTEEKTIVDRRSHKLTNQKGYRNSSTDTISHKELLPSTCHRQIGVNKKAHFLVTSSVDEESTRVSDEYTYAYDRSWSMGVQLNLLNNLTQNVNGSADNFGGQQELLNKSFVDLDVIRTGDKERVHPSPIHHSGLENAENSMLSGLVHEKKVDKYDSNFEMKKSSKSPHLTCVSPKPRNYSQGNHNLLASGVLSSVDISTSFSGSSSSNFYTKDENSESAGILRPMSRLLADLDNFSTDSYDEPWDVRHGKVLAQLTSKRFIDPSEVLSEVESTNCYGHSPPRDKLHNPERRSYNNTSSGAAVATSPNRNAVSPKHEKCKPSISIIYQNNSSAICNSNFSANSSLTQATSDTSAENLKLLLEQPWFHPSFTRSDAENCLRQAPEGSFLVRNSETNKNDFSLTIKHLGFLHMKISKNPQGKFVLGEYSQPYTSIPEMILHYEQTRVPVKGADSVTLCYPR